MRHARRFTSQLFNAAHDFSGALDGGRIGQLHIEQQVTFVLLGNETGRCAIELPIGKHKQTGVCSQCHKGDAQQTADNASVNGNDCIEDWSSGGTINCGAGSDQAMTSTPGTASGCETVVPLYQSTCHYAP